MTKCLVISWPVTAICDINVQVQVGESSFNSTQSEHNVQRNVYLLKLGCTGVVLSYNMVITSNIYL